MKTFLTRLGFFDNLPWFVCSRWLYHLIKILTGAAIAFTLLSFAVPLRWIVILVPLIGVCLPHVPYFRSTKFNTELKDTIFDCVITSAPLLLLIPKMGQYAWWAWITMVAGAGASFGLYLLMLRWKWNRP